MRPSIPETMQAVTIGGPGGPDVLRLATVPVPEVRDGEVLVRVDAAGVNRPDVLQRLGLYPVPPDASPFPGLEIAGTVVAAGAGAERWREGDRVTALAHGGGYARYCRVDARHCLPAPARLTAVEAAAIPETYFTVWYNVFMRCGLTSGETLLVHGGSSGIGTTAIQLGKAFGCTVVTTAGSDEKCRFCESLGADRAIDYRAEDWPAEVSAFTEGRGVDVVLDMVAGPYAQKNIDALARDGRYALIAFLEGPRAELDLRGIVTRRLTLTGSTLRPQTPAEKAAIATELEQRVWPLLESGRIAPIIDSTFTLDQASAAHELMESSRHKGKIVLVVAEETRSPSSPDPRAL